jgi:hypothetical protein
MPLDMYECSEFENLLVYIYCDMMTESRTIGVAEPEEMAIVR